MPPVLGCDPGTSSLDLLRLDDGLVSAQVRLTPVDLQAHPDLLLSTLTTLVPVDLIAGPSGYGLPLVRGEDVTEADLDAMSLTRPDERGRPVGVIGFRSWVRALID